MGPVAKEQFAGRELSVFETTKSVDPAVVMQAAAKLSIDQCETRSAPGPNRRTHVPSLASTLAVLVHKAAVGVKLSTVGR